MGRFRGSSRSSVPFLTNCLYHLLLLRFLHCLIWACPTAAEHWGYIELPASLGYGLAVLEFVHGCNHKAVKKSHEDLPISSFGVCITLPQSLGVAFGRFRETHQ
ncbi:hypothetical protein B0T10DRAFT_286194 [Thelonectria olida]|uniref:Secreted protein n=1 Tax=Thelonectria olida TaxID=1576542 RepID=A0A9P9ANI8_9HYPO|nr:hypothetical protein B0T10DRAFT_286194 [Thelonectria olida]